MNNNQEEDIPSEEIKADTFRTINKRFNETHNKAAWRQTKRKLKSSLALIGREESLAIWIPISSKKYVIRKAETLGFKVTEGEDKLTTSELFFEW